MTELDLCNYGQLRALLDAEGFHFSKSMGQNFLIDASVPERIADSASLDAHTGVLEIGPGVGALTQQLCLRAGAVTAVELDGSLAPLLEKTVGTHENLQIVFGDVLKTDLPALLERTMPGLRHVVCANLPYNVTTPVLTMLLESGLFESITVMIQREVARRICAEPGTGEYGAFSVLCRYHADCRALFDVSPSCFTPQPKVWSSVIRLTPWREKPVQPQDEALYFRVVRAAFGQRRKTLVNALSAGFGGLSKPELARAVEEAGFAPTVRGETLSPADFAKLADTLVNMI